MVGKREGWEVGRLGRRMFEGRMVGIWDEGWLGKLRRRMVGKRDGWDEGQLG